MKSLKKMKKRLSNPIDSGFSLKNYITPLHSGVPKKGAKYNNVTINRDGLKHDSMSEFVRYTHLKHLQENGVINGLRRQVIYRFAPNAYYKADFVYNVISGEEIVEDVKCPRLMTHPKFLRNIKLMKEIFGKEVNIVKPGRLMQDVPK